MQAAKTKLMTLIGQPYKMFKIPVYQRTYDWETIHCKKLVNDIFKSMERGKEHFTGTIVYLNESNLSENKVALLIDGQQRITTIMILLKALAISAKENNFIKIYDDIHTKFLNTDTQDFEQICKLIPTEEDRDEYDLLMSENFKKMNSSLSFYKNYSLIKNILKNKLKTKKDFTSFYQTLINNITIVELSLDNGLDDPQEIFESINSTGLDLSNADLVRNFLLMNAEKQNYLYKQYWKPLFNQLGKENLEEFVYVYLTYKLEKRISNRKDIYSLFVDLYNENNYTNEEMLKELATIANYYEVFIKYTSSYSKEINDMMMKFREIEQSTLHPFLIYIFKDFDKNIIDEDIVIKVLKYFLNYHIKRMICNSASASLRGLYINLYNRIFKVKKNKTRYYDSIATYMEQLQTKDAVPADITFKNSLESIDLYKQRTLAKFLLGELENNNSKEKIDLENISIEHILPQTLDNSWVVMLGDDYENIHEKYLHTLGNLSLTGYNSDMGNKSFSKKKEMLGKKSKINFLNKDILEAEKWTDIEIISRAQKLSANILDIFRISEYDSKDLRYEEVLEFDLLSESEDYKGTRLYSYKFNNMEIERKEKSYWDMVVNIVTELDSIDSKIMDDVAEKLFNPWDDGKKDIISKESDESTDISLKIRDNLYLNGYLSSHTVIEMIRKLMLYYDIDENNFKFFTKIKDNS
jgi:uncharacterized protein with ParB-like and HNH nuclease domain